MYLTKFAWLCYCYIFQEPLENLVPEQCLVLLHSASENTCCNSQRRSTLSVVSTALTDAIATVFFDALVPAHGKLLAQFTSATLRKNLIHCITFKFQFRCLQSANVKSVVFAKHSWGSRLSAHRCPWIPPWWSACYVTSCSRACRTRNRPIRRSPWPSPMTRPHPLCWGWWWCDGHESARLPSPADVEVPLRPQWRPWRRQSCCCWSEGAAGRGSRGDGSRPAAAGLHPVSCPADLARWWGETAPVSSWPLNPGKSGGY